MNHFTVLHQALSQNVWDVLVACDKTSKAGVKDALLKSAWALSVTDDESQLLVNNVADLLSTVFRGAHDVSDAQPDEFVLFFAKLLGVLSRKALNAAYSEQADRQRAVEDAIKTMLDVIPMHELWQRVFLLTLSVERKYWTPLRGYR